MPSEKPAEGELKVGCPMCKRGTVTANERRAFDVWSDGENLRLIPRLKATYVLKCDRCGTPWKEADFVIAWKTHGRPRVG